jgi:hypothetical protein
LIGAGIDLREQIAGVDRLTFGECDLGQLPLDLAAHDVGVIGNDGADAAQIDRHILAGHLSGHDGHRRHDGFRRGRRASAGHRERAAADDGDGNDGNNGVSQSHGRAP